jgi:tungstate transport system ATP-binding protein
MVFDPAVLLLDEPTANLDPLNILEFERLVVDIHKRQGKPIILVTHDLGQAERFSQQILFLARGRFLKYGPTRQVLQQPQDETAQRFLSRQIAV